MRTSRTASALAVAALTLTSLVGTAVSADAVVPARYKNCTTLRKTFKHGVGRSTARDHTSAKDLHAQHQEVQQGGQGRQEPTSPRTAGWLSRAGAGAG